MERPPVAVLVGERGERIIYKGRLVTLVSRDAIARLCETRGSGIGVSGVECLVGSLRRDDGPVANAASSRGGSFRSGQRETHALSR